MDKPLMTKYARFTDIFARSAVVAVVTLPDAALAVPVAQALARGGVKTLEITLRTPAGLESIRRVANEVPEILVGAGTVLRPQDMADAIKAGAAFTISPGSSPALLAAGRESPVPYLPGVGTASELMAGLEQGYECFKLFPVMAMGHVLLPRILGGPFPRARFCCNGGVALKSSKELLDEPNVYAIGAGWLAPPEALAGHHFDTIEGLGRAAAQNLRKT